ncbi:helix-turn-helix domain-containing protein [Streptomyces sp. NPDC046909]|uniref:PucR family transcriptional regulator n=1 Tax=Streptomyces sp. NPDC046909 TaxID=3155617 RepID=UPI0033CC73DB
MPSQRVRELFRDGAKAVLAMPSEAVDELHAATLDGLGSRLIVEDSTLVEATRRANAANLRQWAAFNVHNPGERVPPYLGPEVLEVARELVRRGLDDRALNSYRTSQNVAWRLWMDICFALSTDSAELQGLLEVSSLSISAFIDDSVQAVSARVDDEREELTRGTHAERMAAVTLLLEGAPIPRQRAEVRLGYALTGDHTAAVIWADTTADGKRSDPHGPATSLERAADALMQAVGAPRRLTVVSGATSLWIWLPTARTVREDDLKSRIAGMPEVRIAIGRSGRDLDGFRRSHLDATTAQRMISRIASSQQVALYRDIQLVSLLTADMTRADEFVTDTLGALAAADTEIRDTVSTYIRAQCNTSEAARMLFTHRNTVIRRLDRADALLPRPLAENVVDIAAALEVVRLRTVSS